MSICVAYLSETGNTEKLARTAACFLPESELLDLTGQPLSTTAECCVLGFGVKEGTCPVAIWDALEGLSNKTLILFATAAFGNVSMYKEHIERQICAFIPENCDYRGFFMCRGAVSDRGKRYLEGLFPQEDGAKEEALQEIFNGAVGKPDTKDLTEFRAFLKETIK